MSKERDIEKEAEIKRVEEKAPLCLLSRLDHINLGANILSLVLSSLN